jgi:cytochrome P450
MTTHTVDRIEPNVCPSRLDLVTLHRDEQRHGFYRERRADPPFFDRAVNAWIVTDAGQALALLQSPHLEVAHYERSYEELQERSGHAFENLLFAYRHVPLCLNGAEHREARRRSAAFLNGRKPVAAAAILSLVEDSFVLLESRSEVDLAAEVLEPLVTRLLLSVVGVDERALSAKPTATIFDRLLGLRKRLRLEQEVSLLRAAIRDALQPDALPEDVGLLLALCILGQDALFGTVGESLFQILKAQAGRKLSEMEFPPAPTHTGVPYVERTVTHPIEIAGLALQPGSRLRLMLQSFSYTEDPDDRTRLFGAGVHSCLGRPLSLDLWGKITKRLSQIERRVEILRYELRTDDYLFTCPKTFLIRLKP